MCTGSISYVTGNTVSADLKGISIASSATVNCQNNTVGSLTADDNAVNPVNVYGLYKANTAGTTTISNNTFANLTNDGTNTGTAVGVYYNGGNGADNAVSRNFISNLVSTNGAPLYGMRIDAGATTYSNNIVSLGGTNQNVIYGIYDAGSNTCNLYFNTVYINGIPSGGVKNSYALYSAVNGNTRNYRNNIFDNARSTNGSHYAAYIPGTSGLTLNYNDYWVSGTGGFVGRFAALNQLTLANWQAATSQEANGLNNPLHPPWPQITDSNAPTAWRAC